MPRHKLNHKLPNPAKLPNHLKIKVDKRAIPYVFSVTDVDVVDAKVVTPKIPYVFTKKATDVLRLCAE